MSSTALHAWFLVLEANTRLIQWLQNLFSLLLLWGVHWLQILAFVSGISPLTCRFHGIPPLNLIYDPSQKRMELNIDLGYVELFSPHCVPSHSAARLPLLATQVDITLCETDLLKIFMCSKSIMFLLDLLFPWSRGINRDTRIAVSN